METATRATRTAPTDFRIDRIGERDGFTRARRISKRLTGADLLPPQHAIDSFVADMWAGDPLAEAFVDEVYAGPGGRRRGRALLDRALRDGVSAVEDAPDAMRALFAEFERTPEWVDRELVEQGAAIWRRWGTDLFVAAGAETLEMYTESAVAMPLSLTGGYAGENALHRFLETVRFWIDVSEPEALFTPGSAGRSAAMQVRVMHVSVRRHVARHPEWDADAWGLPISQAWMTMTLMGGSIASAVLMGRLGYATLPSETRALLHYQRYLGHLMGVHPRWYPETVTEAVQLMVLTNQARSFTAGAHGAELIESFPRAFAPTWEGSPLDQLRQLWNYHLIAGAVTLMMAPGTRRRYDVPSPLPSVLLPLARAPWIAGRETARRVVPGLDSLLDRYQRSARERWYREHTGGRTAAFVAADRLRR